MSTEMIEPGSRKELAMGALKDKARPEDSSSSTAVAISRSEARWEDDGGSWIEPSLTECEQNCAKIRWRSR